MSEFLRAKHHVLEAIVLGIATLVAGMVYFFSLKPDTVPLRNSNTTVINSNSPLNLNTWVCENNVWVNRGGDLRVANPGGTCTFISGLPKPAHVYPGHIIYNSSGFEFLDVLLQDCKQREGRFSTCGSPCDPDDKQCITVCAYTCETSK